MCSRWIVARNIFLKRRWKENKNFRFRFQRNIHYKGFTRNFKRTFKEQFIHYLDKRKALILDDLGDYSNFVFIDYYDPHLPHRPSRR